MFTDPSLTPAGQLFMIVELFCKTMAAEVCKRRVWHLSVPLWNRVRRLERRFSAVYAQWKAGTLPVLRARSVAAVATPHPNPPGQARGQACPQGERERGPASLLPRAWRWMYRMLPESAATLGSYVGSVVYEHPEMRAFVEGAPRVGRILRPLCRLAGVKAPEWLALPKRVRGAYPPPQPSPSRGEGEDSGAVVRRRRTPREVAEAAIAKSRRTGKPIDPKKLGSVAYGYVLHWPRDEHCPPPEVGYAPMRLRIPKDYKPPPGDWQ